ncbi:MAG: O-antigen ligase family protein [Pyrinomonadaceae bacterium]
MSSSTVINSATDSLIPQERTSALGVWLDRVIVVWIFALAVFAPHSIAAAEISWMAGMTAWVARYVFVRPRRKLFRTPLDYALLGFFALSMISSFISYDPIVSIGKLRAVSLFTIAYLVAENIHSRRVLRLLVLTLVASCMINVVYTLGERVVGRGIKVEALAAASPLRIAGVQDGDTLLTIDGRKLHRPEELIDALAASSTANAAPARVKIYRFEAMPVIEIPRGQFLNGTTTLEKLGIGSWARGRDWRASGFYGHYVTYAEVLQLILSLAFGLFIALRQKKNWRGALLAVALFGIGGCLLLTVTRASWLAFLIAAFVIVLIGASRRTALALVACAVLVVPTGLFVLQQKRNVKFVDQSDGSILWRETVYREGLQLLVSKPRHLLVGVGMDSILRHWRKWGMFDNGRLPIGHMHQTLLQLALERGVPTLLAWLALIWLYARMLWRRARRKDFENWIEHGLALGALGGLCGFFASAMVHYNFGDSEVAIVLYFIMGLCLVLEREAKAQDHRHTSHRGT